MVLLGDVPSDDGLLQVGTGADDPQSRDHDHPRTGIEGLHPTGSSAGVAGQIAFVLLAVGLDCRRDALGRMSGAVVPQGIDPEG